MREISGVQFYDTLEEILQPSHCALLVVDMQNDFCSPDGHFARNAKDVHAIASIIPGIGRLIEVARLAGVPVVYIQQTTLGDYASDSPAWMYFKTRDGKSPDYTMDGSWGQQIVAELTPRADELLIKKHRPSAFHLTNLDLVLRNRRVQTVVITGCLTQGCVQATATDASFHDYYTVIVDDCVQSTSQEMHQNALRFLRSRYDVLSSAEVAGIWFRES